jgi:hypothetical protein
MSQNDGGTEQTYIDSESDFFASESSQMRLEIPSVSQYSLAPRLRDIACDNVQLVASNLGLDSE